MLARHPLPHTARELLAFGGLVLVSLTLWWPVVTDPGVKFDEVYYLNAAQLVGQGQSPYREPWFFYPPPFAVASAWFVEELGERPYVITLRLLSLVGACWVVWWSLRWTGWTLWWRLLLGALLLRFAGPMVVGLTYGNVSALAIALVVAALVCWRRQPLVSALLMGLSLAIKPIALLAPPLLFLHRPAQSTRTHRIAGALAVGLAGLLFLVGGDYLREFVAHGNELPMDHHNLSVQRLLYCFGLSLPAPAIAAVVLAAALWTLRRRTIGERELLCGVAVVSLLALPIVWVHTMLLALPVQGLAAGAAWREAREGIKRRNRLTLLIGVALAITSILLSHSEGGLASQPLWLQGVALAVPVLSPSFLLWYVLSSRSAGKAAPIDPPPDRC